jgi:hypothetical protein
LVGTVETTDEGDAGGEFDGAVEHGRAEAHVLSGGCGARDGRAERS